jgi:hypothetical protein
MTDRTYYDQNGVEIEEGDLLEVFHFIHRRRNRKIFMYHVAVIRDDYWAGRSYYDNKAHYWLKSVANKETGIIQGCRIIFKQNHEKEERLREEGRKRLQKLSSEHNPHFTVQS